MFQIKVCGAGVNNLFYFHSNIFNAKLFLDQFTFGLDCIGDHQGFPFIHNSFNAEFEITRYVESNVFGIAYNTFQNAETGLNVLRGGSFGDH